MEIVPSDLSSGDNLGSELELELELELIPKQGFFPSSLNSVRSRRRGKNFLISFLIVPMYFTKPAREWSHRRGSSRKMWDSPSSPVARTTPLVGISSLLSPPLDAITAGIELKHLQKNLDARTSLIWKVSPPTSESKISLSLFSSIEDRMSSLLQRLPNKGRTYVSNERGATLVN